ncbi:hypothetical protein A1O3_07311 [Capronia epimyces CBS 606.96]|uniref:Transcription factor domain-containing protein n=1 Tax=Capronia epimyces CBS 606.96 TaxID=1182542 RepID=W9XLE3_9EURO|nr:uncharacterized protein A1O3_07311 [Capronia epimyces CBS 606.96]EXJ81023.1 hypothetical protein A1O3_07311 [Capronia epimyces CBS 606.96]
MGRSSLDSGKAHDLKPAVSPAASPNFAFVNLADDLVSLNARKITNQHQRYVIRSHVMKNVRQELVRGRKRTIGERSNSDKSVSTASDADSSGTNESRLPLTVTIKQEFQEPTNHALTPGRKAGSSCAMEFAEPGSNVTMSYTPAISQIDPFLTLPCRSLAPKSLDGILRFGFDVLIPLTFSSERQDRLTRQGLVLQTKIADPPTFWGMIGVFAAHKAIFQGDHKDLAPSDVNHDDLITDPDYKKVKHEALVAVRRKIERRERMDQFMIEACFGLSATATVVGNFEEARMHLKGVAQLMSMFGVAQDSVSWLPLSIVKVSVGLLSMPIFELPWTRCPLPREIEQRITPTPDSGMTRLASAFQHMDELSQPLRVLLLTSRDICNFCELNATDPSGLSSAESAALDRKATELEFDLLAYPYKFDSFHGEYATEPQLPPLEAVVRLAALGFLSFTPHTIFPPTGLGRALTHHQKRAFKRWLQARSTTCGVPELKAITWALFTFTQGSLMQPEEVFFSRHLLRLTRQLSLVSWQDIETILSGFLYIPSLQSSLWRTIWTASFKDCTPA